MYRCTLFSWRFSVSNPGWDTDRLEWMFFYTFPQTLKTNTRLYSNKARRAPSKNFQFIIRGPSLFWKIKVIWWDHLTLCVSVCDSSPNNFNGCTNLYFRSRKTEIIGRGDSLRWPRDTLYPLKLALTSPTNGSRSVGIVCLRTQATEFSFSLVPICIKLGT
jgi:hypothetical protein